MTRLSIGQAWDETKDVFRRDGNLIAIVALALMVLPGTLGALVTPQPAPGQMPSLGWGTLISFITLVVGIIGQLAVSRVALGHRQTVGQAIGEAARRTPAYLGAQFLWLLPFALLIVPFALQIQANPGAAPPAAAMAVMALDIVFVFFAVRLLLSTPVAAAELLGPVGILKRSWNLTRGRWWRLFGFLVVFLIGLVVLGGGVAAILGVLVSLVLGPPEPMSVGALIVALGSQLVSAAMTSLLMIMLARIYLQLSGEAQAASVPHAP